jgi:hypothetical protein
MVGPPNSTDDDETDDSDPDDRGRGVLTKKDRSFLRGDADFGPKSNSARRARQRIRDRTRNAVRDFGLIADALQDRDREQIFERGAEDDLAEFNGGLVGALRFIYSGVEHGKARAPTGVGFKGLVEHAVRRAVYDFLPVQLREAQTVDVAFDVSQPYLTDIRNPTAVGANVERGRWDKISDNEARVFLRWLANADALDADAAVRAIHEARDERPATTNRPAKTDDELLLPSDVLDDREGDDQ